jgi:hypothetical protein
MPAMDASLNFDLENSPADELPLPDPYQRGRQFR